jgi:hypothetical protein
MLFCAVAAERSDRTDQNFQNARAEVRTSTP